LPAITRPTRITEFSSSLIDNIFFDCHLNKYSSYIIYDDLSDHLPTYLNVDLSCAIISDTNNSNKRHFSNINFDKFSSCLESFDWISFSNNFDLGDDPNMLYNKFHETFFNMFEVSFPLVKKNLKGTIHKSNSCPWMTDALIKCCRKKSRLLKKLKLHPCTVNRVKYKAYCNCLKTTLRNAERNYYSNRFLSCANDMRKTWKTINTAMNNGRDTSLPLNLVIDNKLTNDPLTIVNELNKYFVNIGSTLANKIPVVNKSIYDYLPSSKPESMALYPTDEYEVLKLISELKDVSSPGLDEIPTNIVKFASKHILSTLVKLINCSFARGIFPSNLKIAKVIPIYKNGDATHSVNYRPISILNTFSKIYERAMATRINSFIGKKQQIKNRNMNCLKI